MTKQQQIALRRDEYTRFRDPEADAKRRAEREAYWAAREQRVAEEARKISLLYRGMF